MSMKHLFRSKVLKLFEKAQNSEPERVCYELEYDSSTMYPPEMWEMILQKIDNPLDLLKLQTVCKTWQKTIEFLLSTCKKWKTMCLNDIPEDRILRILEQICPKIKLSHRALNSNKLTPPIWRAIYRSYRKWQLCLTVEPTKIDTALRLPQFFNERVTCIEVWNDVLAVGTNKGSIYFRKLGDPKAVFFTADHKNFIERIKFWYIDHRLIAVSSSKSATLRFWDVFEMKEINTRGYLGRVLSTTMNQCFCEEFSTLTEYQFIAGEIKPTASVDLALYSNDDPVTMTLDGETMTVFSYSAKTITTTVLIRSDSTRSYNVVKKTFIVLPDSWPQSITCLYPDYFVISASGNELQFGNPVLTGSGVIQHCDQQSIKCIGTRTKSTFTSAVLHANLLIFGVDTGIVCIFRVNKEDLACDSIVPRCKIYVVDNEAIILVNVAEIQGQQCIIAATKKKVHIIKFIT